MLGDVQRDRSPVAGAVEHRDRDRLLIVGEGRGRERKPSVIVMVRHADQRHRFFQSQLPAENSRCAPNLDQAALVDAGKIGSTEQSEAGRRFFDDRTRQRGEKHRIIPGCDKGGDVADVAPHAAQRGNHRVERLARIFGGVFVSRKAFFFIVDDDARTVGLRHLNERDAGVVGSGCRKAREIDRLAAPLSSGAYMAIRASQNAEPQPAKSRSAHGFRRQPARGARKADAEPSWTAAEQFVCSVSTRANLLGAAITLAAKTPTCINHKWCRATMPFRLANKRVLAIGEFRLRHSVTDKTLDQTKKDGRKPRRVRMPQLTRVRRRSPKSPWVATAAHAQKKY